MVVRCEAITVLTLQTDDNFISFLPPDLLGQAGVSECRVRYTLHLLGLIVPDQVITWYGRCTHSSARSSDYSCPVPLLFGVQSRSDNKLPSKPEPTPQGQSLSKTNNDTSKSKGVNDGSDG
ncbi:hypothetical protein BDW69DRAFT_13049 [Aspergillus filifer]